MKLPFITLLSIFILTLTSPTHAAPVESPETVLTEINGTTAGYNRIRSGKVQFSLVIPAITKKNLLLGFDLSMVISPEEVSIISDDLKVPTNISLPKQTHFLGIFPFTVNKPEYRTFTRKPATNEDDAQSNSWDQRVVALNGWFPLKKVARELKAGKSILDVANHFKFLGLGTQDLEVTQGTPSEANIDVSQIKLSTKHKLTAQDYDMSKYSALTLALTEKEGWLYPTDLKKIPAGKTKALVFPKENDKKYFLSALVDNFTQSLAKPSNLVGSEEEEKSPYNFQKMSFVLNDAENPKSTPFLDFIAPPELNGDQITFTPPSQVEGITPLATYIVYSKVIKKKLSKVVTEIKTPLWWTLEESWVDSIPLPELNSNEEEDGVLYRWEVMYIGDSNNQRSSEEPLAQAILKATHITRNAIQ